MAAMAGVASSGDLARLGRWDAPFLLLLQRHGEAAKRLEGKVSEAEAAELLLGGGIPREALEGLRALSRGNGEGWGAIERGIREYPLLALAAALESAPARLDQEREERLKEAKKLEATAARIRALGKAALPEASGAEGRRAAAKKAPR